MVDLAGGIALIQSRTFWAALIGLIATIVQALGLSSDVPWLSDPATIDKIMQVVSMLSMLATMYFRSAATQQVTGVVKAK
jgi:uncharacterized membrane protein